MESGHSEICDAVLWSFIHTHIANMGVFVYGGLGLRQLSNIEDVAILFIEIASGISVFQGYEL